MRLAEIRVYPVKSMGVTLPTEATVEPWGLAGDRRWVAVRPDGAFLTQRDAPHMARILARNTPSGLMLTRADGETRAIPFPTPQPTQLVQVWGDQVPAAPAGQGDHDWLSAALDQPCQLAYLADPTARKLSGTYAQPGETVSFADGFPILLASSASLADLNTRLADPIPIDRFRPNLVIEGAPAWAEDSWRRLRIGPVILRVAKPCERCLITTIDQTTGTRPDKSEPLRTLGTFRRDPRGVMFGQNLIPETLGRLSVGDPVEILEIGAPNVALAKPTV